MSEMVTLPAPQKELDFPLMKALANRRSTRKWSDKPLSKQDLSNLLWAACGQTREQKGRTKSKRTTPSACNAQEIRVYVLLEDGVFHYHDDVHALEQTHSVDVREFIGTQKMMKSAPAGLVFVADLLRMTSPLFRSEEIQQLFAWVDTGYISQNVYLFCAAFGLGTVSLGLVDRDLLSEKMSLKAHEKIVLTQVVGYLKNNQ